MTQIKADPTSNGMLGRGAALHRGTDTVKLQRDSTGIDWNAVIELFKLAELSGREGDKIRRAFERSDLMVFAFEGESLIGAARALTDFEYHATIYDVAVHPRHQRRGVGTRMMHELLSSLQVWRVLLVADQGVRPFYSRLGFEPYGDVLARLERSNLLDG